MADDGERYTDKEFENLKKRLEKIYEQAGKELQEKLEKKIRSANKDIDRLYKGYEKEKAKGNWKEAWRFQAEYKERLAKSMTEGNWYKEAVDLMAEELTHVNERALAYTQDRTPKVYEYNQKYTQNEVSKELAGYNFHLKDEHTVKNLTKRLTAKRLNLSKDKRWNSKKVNAQLLQGILQGESIPDIAKRIERVTKDTYKASLRTARTMMTGAQNEGRHDRATQLAQQGLLMKKVWIATGDDRVRTTHLDADGQEVELDEPFNVGGEELQYPADPVGSPAEVYNCRCKYSNKVVGFVDENGITHMFDIEHEEGLHQQQINAEREKRREKEAQKQKARPFNKEEWDEMLKKNSLPEFEETCREWKTDCSKKELDAVTHYTSNAYWDMNEYLRGIESRISRRDKEAIDECTKALKKGMRHIKKDIIVRRGDGAGGIEALLGGSIRDIAQNPKKYIGVIGKDKGFHSTSPAPHGGFSGIESVIFIPKNSEVMYVAPISRYRSEKELLMQRGAIFRCEHIEVDSRGRVKKVYLTYLGADYD